MKNQKLAFFYRLFLTIILWIGLLISIYSRVELGIRNGNVLRSVVNYFSYFTIQSNIMIAIYFTLASIYTLKKEKLLIFKPYIRGAFVLYITITGVVYAFYLAPYDPDKYGLFFIAKFLLHYVTPIGALIDWFIFEERKIYKWKYALVWLIYPVCYLVYTLIRGFFTEYYPYPFIDIVYMGYSKVSLNALLMSIVFISIGFIYISINKNPYRKRGL